MNQYSVDNLRCNKEPKHAVIFLEKKIERVMKNKENLNFLPQPE